MLNLKPEWWGEPLVQEKYLGKGNLWYDDDDDDDDDDYYFYCYYR
jgi:hypothetical protein